MLAPRCWALPSLRASVRRSKRRPRAHCLRCPPTSRCRSARSLAENSPNGHRTDPRSCSSPGSAGCRASGRSRRQAVFRPASRRTSAWCPISRTTCRPGAPPANGSPTPRPRAAPPRSGSGPPVTGTKSSSPGSARPGSARWRGRPTAPRSRSRVTATGRTTSGGWRSRPGKWIA